MFLIDVFTPVPGVWKFVKTNYKWENENHRLGVFDRSNEEPERTDYNAKKTSTLCGITLLKKSRKNSKKGFFFQKLPFLVFFLDFFSNCTSQRVEVFCVAISASWRFIWAIKHPHAMIFIFRFIIGFYKFWDPWYGGKNVNVEIIIFFLYIKIHLQTPGDLTYPKY